MSQVHELPPRPDPRWARAKRSGAHGLRRGAWYSVVNESSKLVVIEVRKENVPVPRDMVELSDARPTMWSVVNWDEAQLGARRASETDFGLSYAVCPSCGDRQTIEPPRAESLKCDACGGTFEVDWEHPC